MTFITVSKNMYFIFHLAKENLHLCSINYALHENIQGSKSVLVPRILKP
jgi:hypothetical protein